MIRAIPLQWFPQMQHVLAHLVAWLAHVSANTQELLLGTPLHQVGKQLINPLQKVKTDHIATPSGL